MMATTVKSNRLALMKKNKRLILSPIQTLTHYGIVAASLFAGSLPAWSYLKQDHSGAVPQDEFVKISLLFLLVAVFLAFIQYMRLRFKEVYLTFTEEQFQEAIERTKKDLKWRVKKNNKTFFQARRSGFWSSGPGEMITIIKDKDCLLVNSICDPDVRMAGSSFGWNRKNVQVFLKNLTDVLNNMPVETAIDNHATDALHNKQVETKTEKPASEWSLKRIAIRLIAYPFCIFLIVFGIYTVFQPSSANSVFTGFGAAAIAGVYLYSDIKILMDRNRE